MSGAEGPGPDLLAVLVEPLRYPFMARALLAGILVAVAGAVTGSFLLVRRWSLLGDAISHAVLPGVGLAYLLGWPYFTGAMATAVLTAVGIGFLERNTRLKSDAATGLLFLGAFAAGLALLSRVRSSVDVFHILFGNVLGVSPADLRLMAAVAALATVLVVALFKELQLWAFDPLTAEVAGLPVRALHYLMTLLVSATIVAALQAVGVVLALAMLITPPATAYLLSRRFPAMIVLATWIGVLSAVTGLYLSFYLNVASGAAMVLVATAFFLLTLLLAPEQGLVARAWERRRLARAVAAEDVLKALDELGGGEAAVPVAVLAQWTGLGPRAVRQAVARLVAAGWARWVSRAGEEPARVGGDARASRGEEGPAALLTGEGLRQARRLIRTHRLWERYLTDVAGMPWEDVHEVAHQLEHATPPHLAEEMAEALGHPVRDPHGAPIPTPGGEVPALPGPEAVPLHRLPAGTHAVVVRVDDEDPGLLARLRAAGIVPGARLVITAREAGAVRVRAVARGEGEGGAGHGVPGGPPGVAGAGGNERAAEERLSENEAARIRVHPEEGDPRAAAQAPRAGAPVRAPAGGSSAAGELRLRRGVPGGGEGPEASVEPEAPRPPGEPAPGREEPEARQP